MYMRTRKCLDSGGRVLVPTAGAETASLSREAGPGRVGFKPGQLQMHGKAFF